MNIIPSHIHIPIHDCHRIIAGKNGKSAHPTHHGSTITIGHSSGHLIGHSSGHTVRPAPSLAIGEWRDGGSITARLARVKNEKRRN